MFLNHGIAIVKYSNKEEAIKAQSALNNCSLGNTTIQVNLASETEVQQYLTNFQQQQQQQQQQSVNNSSIYNTNNNGGDLNNEYMIAAAANNGGGAWNSSAIPNTSLPNASLQNASNMWSFNQQNTPNNLWNIDNSNSALQNYNNLLPDNLLGEST